LSFAEDFAAINENSPFDWKAYEAALSGAVERRDPDDLHGMEQVARLEGIGRDDVAGRALLVLPAWGKTGVEALRQQAVNGPHYGSALEILLDLAAGLHPILGSEIPNGIAWTEDLQQAIDAQDGERIVARANLVRPRGYFLYGDVNLPIYPLLEQVRDGTIRAIRSIAMDHPEALGRASAEHIDLLLSLVVDTRLVINRELLTEFESLLDRGPGSEETLHQFLREHPTLLDPLAAQLVTKYECGAEFIVDYMVRRLNDAYIVVELEQSTDQIFANTSLFSRPLNEALSQVAAFQLWFTENIDYARKTLPGIRDPEAVIVIGRTAPLTESQRKRLAWENAERRGRLRILTYDDLLAQAKTVYENSLERPPVLSSRDIRTHRR